MAAGDETRNPSTPTSTLLLVDDDARYLDTIAPLFEAWSGGRWKILRASSVARALALLKEHPVDVLVADYQMPVADGLQLMQIAERSFPGMPKAVLTSTNDPAVRSACLTGGADLVLAKPADPALLRDVFAHLGELITMRPQQGFRGVVRQADLAEIIQIECLGTKSSSLEVRAGSQRGRIVIREGRVIHAEMGSLRGEDAFNRIVALKGGDFSLGPFLEPETETISGSWEMLIMEAARVRDELGDASHPQPVAPEAPENSAASSLQDAGGKPAHPPAPESPVPSGLLIVDAEGGVLHQRGLDDVAARVEILRWAARAASRVQKLAPLGRPDGAVFVGDISRVSLRFEAGWNAWAGVTVPRHAPVRMDNLAAHEVLVLATARSARDIGVERPSPEFSLSILGELVKLSEDARTRLERLAVTPRAQCWRFRSGQIAIAHHLDGTARLAILAPDVPLDAVHRWLDAVSAPEPNAR